MIKLFKLNREDIECINKFKEKGEGLLSNSQITYFKNWRYDNQLKPPSKDKGAHKKKTKRRRHKRTIRHKRRHTKNKDNNDNKSIRKR